MRTVCIAFLALAPAAALVAHSAPSGPNQDTVVLESFVVNTDKDAGYIAVDSLAGGRTATSIKLTPTAISSLTRTFLDDVAITDVRELVQYSMNAEISTNENQAGTGQNPVVNAQSLTPVVLIRGATASVGMDYFTSITPSDAYRVGRYEDNRGPNSILFGLGAPGGLINESSKIANTARESGLVRYGAGSFDRHRLELDANRVLLKER